MARILLAEDDDSLRAFLTTSLSRAGHDVAGYGDGDSAWEALEHSSFDLLLTDIVMPGSVNGVALGRMAMMRQRGIRLIYLTAYDIPGLDREADGPVLRKPVADSALVAEVRRVLAQG